MGGGLFILMASMAGSDPLSWAVAAGAGLLSFLSPCVLPLIPVYLSYLAGVAAGDQGISAVFSGEAPHRQVRLLQHAFFFILGFTLVFVLMGLSATWVGRFLLLRQVLLRRLAGLVVLALGLRAGGFFRLPVWDRIWQPLSARRPAGVGGRKGALAALLLGISVSAGWMPCIGPILGSILIYAGTADTAVRGALLLAFYAGGLGLPFLAAAAALDRLDQILGFLRRYAPFTERISGLLLVALGVALFFDWWRLFSN